MSLIQEALRRQQEEAGQGGEKLAGASDSSTPTVPTQGKSRLHVAPPAITPPPQDGPPVIAPPPLPPTPRLSTQTAVAPSVEHADGSEGRQRTWLTLVGILLIILILLGGAVWMLMFAAQRMKARHLAETGVETVVLEEAAPGTAASDADTSEGMSVAGAPESPATPSTGAGPATAPASEESSPAAVASAAHVGESPTPPPTTPSMRPAKTPSPPEATSKLVWPSLVLSGVVGRGSNGSAIINGEVLGVGEVIEGVKILGVRQQGADLEYKGESRFLKVGNSMQ